MATTEKNTAETRAETLRPEPVGYRGSSIRERGGGENKAATRSRNEDCLVLKGHSPPVVQRKEAGNREIKGSSITPVRGGEHHRKDVTP